MTNLPLLAQSTRAREALASVRVLYTDLDGTLVARGGCVLADADGEPSTMVAEAIVAARRAGLTIVPVSGRERDQLFELTRLLGWSDYIAEAGAIIVTGAGAGENVLFNNGSWPPVADGRTPYEMIAGSGAYEALTAAYPGLVEYYSASERPRESTHLLRGCLPPDAGAVLATVEPAVALVDNGIIRSRGTLTCEGTPHAYHLVPAGVSKAQAIALDLARRGLSREHAAAIGDSATDIEMADSVGVMALVANAFDSEGVVAALAQPNTQRDNLYRTDGSRGQGWAEFVALWLEATVGA